MFFDLLFGTTLAMICMTMCHAGSEYGQEHRDFSLNRHNELRRGEHGCQVNKLVYDQELEKQAKYWVERCVFQHENKEGRGENLAWNTNTASEKELIGQAIQDWFNEKKDYSYGQNSCGTTAACHYTQLVWADTNRVGCYSTRCAHLTGGAANAWYYACFYTPKGNWVGEKPYQKSCATPCLPGQTEDNGLCAGEGKKVVVCEDESPNCGLWSGQGQCQANPGYMKAHCKKSCGTC